MQAAYQKVNYQYSHAARLLGRWDMYLLARPFPLCIMSRLIACVMKCLLSEPEPVDDHRNRLLSLRLSILSITTVELFLTELCSAMLVCWWGKRSVPHSD